MSTFLHHHLNVRLDLHLDPRHLRATLLSLALEAMTWSAIIGLPQP